MIADRLSALRVAIAAATNAAGRVDNPKLVLVSKYVAEGRIREAYAAGHRCFGENKAQELRDKHTLLPDDIEWHFIGRLQANKVKYVVGAAALIHSVDSVKCAAEIQKQAEKRALVQPCLLQCNTSREPSKAGIDPDALVDTWEDVLNFPNISLRGLMTIGSFVDDENIVKRDFLLLARLREQVRRRGHTQCTELSMGMSDDWPIAVETGATLLRIGSRVFGARA